MRRAEPLHAPSLLIDQGRRCAAERAAHLLDQPAQLFGPGDVAAKEDEAPRLRFAEKCAFPIREFGSGQAGYESAHRGRLARAPRQGQAHTP